MLMHSHFISCIGVDFWCRLYWAEPNISSSPLLFSICHVRTSAIIGASLAPFFPFTSFTQLNFVISEVFNQCKFERRLPSRLRCHVFLSFYSLIGFTRSTPCRFLSPLWSALASLNCCCLFIINVLHSVGACSSDPAYKRQKESSLWVHFSSSLGAQLLCVLVSCYKVNKTQKVTAVVIHSLKLPVVFWALGAIKDKWHNLLPALHYPLWPLPALLIRLTRIC